ncbi:hypothetical protein QA649_19700 [Bradyrhizobium sp. CB1717]|uniref:DUF6680 family protein n=1 Tax=Bradyrhizobium sp. CB1717 TaxID=3039154 RepID=UPI0024B1C409|nr:DUF6680 family protein [Bradyrhizobium sp. CB1717]WFU28356.1 hypothetical protein QA649_19700 [Bradyrhizobium sp. CB1717]
MNIDWAVVFATLVGPVLAVQAQKFIERAAEKKMRRMRIFEALMTNRATRLSDAYVQALNQIDLEFHSKSDKPVIDTWRALFGELNNPLPDNTEQAMKVAWIERCNDRLVALLLAMSKSLGRTHSEEEIRRGMYYPQGRVDLEQAQLAVLSGLQRLLEGSNPLRVQNAGEGPSELQLAVLKRLHDAYDESGALRVVFTGAQDERNLN